METIYVAGHKSPDLDSVMGTLSYAYLKTQLNSDYSYQPVVSGELNAETTYTLNKYGLEAPLQKESLAGEKVILIDHNEHYQAIDGMKEAEILEIIDHHKMDFSYSNPIRIHIEPIGSSCSIITKLFRTEGVDIPQNLAAAMLAAVLTDTVITKSPTCTDEDVKIIEELAQIAGISDWKTYGMEIFKVRSSVSNLSEEDIITADYKDFDIGGRKFGIGQVETVDGSEFEPRIEALKRALDTRKEEGSYHSVVLFITDIMMEKSLFIFSSDEPEKIAHAFNVSVKEDGTFIAPVLSRKKQVAPSLIKEFES